MIIIHIIPDNDFRCVKNFLNLLELQGVPIKSVYGKSTDSCADQKTCEKVEIDCTSMILAEQKELENIRNDNKKIKEQLYKINRVVIK